MYYPEIMIVVLVSVSVQVVVPQLEQPKAPDQEIVVTGDKPEPDRDKKVCRRQIPTGSIMPKVTCRTAGEWEELTEKSIADVERFRADRRIRQHIQDSRDNPN